MKISSEKKIIAQALRYSDQNPVMMTSDWHTMVEAYTKKLNTLRGEMQKFFDICISEQEKNNNKICTCQTQDGYASTSTMISQITTLLNILHSERYELQNQVRLKKLSDLIGAKRAKENFLKARALTKKQTQ